jgi:DNA-binding Xre family transcriptional regulator
MRGSKYYMVSFNIEELLKKKNKSKYWLCQKMNITSRNLNRIINGETTSISFKYLEDLCIYLECSLDELINISK